MSKADRMRADRNRARAAEDAAYRAAMANPGNNRPGRTVTDPPDPPAVVRPRRGRYRKQRHRDQGRPAHPAPSGGRSRTGGSSPAPGADLIEPWGMLKLEETHRCSCGSVLIVAANDPETLEAMLRPWRSHRCLPPGWDRPRGWAPGSRGTPARYRGTCGGCGGRIEVGDRIRWAPEGWRCRACLP